MGESDQPLYHRCREAWCRAMPDQYLPDRVWGMLDVAHREPHRSYHTWQHIEECFELAQQWPAPLPNAVWAALLFHDAVYDTRRSDNEPKSAALARLHLAAAGWASDVIDETCRLIELTAKHEAAPEDKMGQVMCDIDLAILGSDPQRFAEYERQIREEYGWVPTMLYRVKRQEVMERFAQKTDIYHQPSWSGRAAQAFVNLRSLGTTPKAGKPTR